MKYLSMQLLVNKDLCDSLKKTFERWESNAPFDYAFFGMRCASTAYYAISKIGLAKKRSRFGMTMKYFYPKLFRKYLLKKAGTNGWKIISHRGRVSRKWEKD